MKKTLSLREQKKLAIKIRESIIEMILEAGSGHPAGSLGVVEQYIVLFFADILNYDSKNPDWPKRDRLVISNGHYTPALYAIMAEAGFFDKKYLKTLRKLGSPLQGHPSKTHLKGLETSSGPLGEGLSQAIGMAIAAKLDGLNYQVYCGMSDGEQEAGNIWEAAMLAGKLKLDNLTAFIDRNNIQIDGLTEHVMPLEPLKEKYKSFGWKVLEADGHNLEAVKNAFLEAKSIFEKPVLIIFHTIPGYGVDFMEWNPEWHGKYLTPEQAQEALKDLRTLEGKIDPGE